MGRGRGFEMGGGGTGHPRPGPPSPPEHQNFFGLDEVLGPVAVSLRREEKESSGGGTLHSYRIIVRTTQVGGGPGIRSRIASLKTCMDSEVRTSPPQLRTLRGTISEDALPPGPPRGLSPRKLLEHVAPRLSPTCLRLGSASPKVPRTLLTLDEQVVSGRRAPTRTPTQQLHTPGQNPACPAPSDPALTLILGQTVTQESWPFREGSRVHPEPCLSK